MFSISGVNATGKFPVHFRPLVFVNGQSYSRRIAKGVARAIRDLEWTALRYPASDTQRSDAGFKLLDTVD